MISCSWHQSLQISSIIVSGLGWSVNRLPAAGSGPTQFPFFHVDIHKSLCIYYLQVFELVVQTTGVNKAIRGH